MNESNQSTIEFWGERGIPIPEIIHRIRERTDKDCFTALLWLTEWMPRETMVQIAQMADGLRSTKRVFEIVEPLFKKEMPDGHAPELLMELCALVIESYVRSADKCFPKASRN